MEFFQILTVTDCTIGIGTIDSKIVTLIRTVITAIQIGVPILLVIWGMLDLGKAVVAQKEDEIKKGQQTFMKRLLAAAIVFFVVVVVRFIVQLATSGETIEDTSCWEAILGWPKK